MTATIEIQGIARHSPIPRRLLVAGIAIGVLGISDPSYGGDGPELSWQKLPDMAVARWEAGTAVLDGKLWVFGGYTPGPRSSTRADVFDPEDRSWRKLRDLPSSISHMNTVLDGRTIWFAGGFKDGYPGRAIREVWRYDVDEDRYTAAPPLPEPRAGGGLALVGRRLHYAGGLLPDRDTDSADHWVLDLDALGADAKWTSAAPLPAPRNQFGAVTLGGKIYALGGQFGHDKGQDDQARVDIYDPETDSWTRGADLPGPHSHAEGSTFVLDGEVFLLGGMTREDGRRRIDRSITRLSRDGRWEVLGRLPLPLSSPAAAIIDEELFVAGGSPNGANPQPGMWASPWPRARRPALAETKADDANTYWPGWLGPKRDGQVAGFRTPEEWPKKLSRGWRVKVGAGYGSPLLAGGGVYQHAREGEDEVLWCLDAATGELVWRKSWTVPFTMGGGGERHGKGPKSSPVLADGRVFTMSITGELSAWSSKSGDLLWRSDHGARFGKSRPYWGAATSPIVDGKRVIVHFGNDDAGALVALDVETGSPVWTQGERGASYSSPLVVEIAGVRQVLDWNHETLAGVDAKSGKLLWEHPFPHVGHNQNMPTPAFHDGLVLLGGENRGVHGIEPRLVDDAWSVRERWHQESVALDMSSAVMSSGSLYGFSHYGKGRLFCLDPTNGEVRWQSPGRVAENVMFLSIPGHVVALLSHGELRIFRASESSYDPVASYRVAESASWAPPVLSNHGVLVKDLDSLTFWRWLAGRELKSAQAEDGPATAPRADASDATLLARIDAGELPEGYLGGKRHQEYVDRRIAGLDNRQRGRIGQLWAEKQRIDPDMQNRGASFVRILEFVAGGEKPPHAIETATRIHRLKSTRRATFDAFVYANRIPESAEKGETPRDLAGRILGRLANQEGRVLLKLPPGMSRDAYLGLKAFLGPEADERATSCVSCHAPPTFSDSKRHVVAAGGAPVLTPSLRNLQRRGVDVEAAVRAKLSAMASLRAGSADEIDHAYATMTITEADVPHLVALLRSLDDVSDAEFRKLILEAKVLDSSELER